MMELNAHQMRRKKYKVVPVVVMATIIACGMHGRSGAVVQRLVEMAGKTASAL
jgi:hypothetical protein